MAGLAVTARVVLLCLRTGSVVVSVLPIRMVLLRVVAVVVAGP